MQKSMLAMALIAVLTAGCAAQREIDLSTPYRATEASIARSQAPALPAALSSNSGTSARVDATTIEGNLCREFVTILRSVVANFIDENELIFRIFSYCRPQSAAWAKVERDLYGDSFQSSVWKLNAEHRRSVEIIEVRPLGQHRYGVRWVETLSNHAGEMAQSETRAAILRVTEGQANYDLNKMGVNVGGRYIEDYDFVDQLP